MYGSTRLQEGEQGLMWQMLANMKCALSVICVEMAGMQERMEAKSGSKMRDVAQVRRLGGGIMCDVR